jgi:Alpha/beta hydrolase family
MKLYFDDISFDGQLQRSQGDEAAKAGHTVSARGAYLRAAEYFRQAFFFHREDLEADKLRRAYSASVSAFRAALDHLGHPGRVLSGDVSGYLFSPSSPGGPRPTILHVGGYDGTAEELYASVAPALDRGYVFAAVDGPGQGAMLYDQHVPMRPDWENVVPGLFGAIAVQPEVDPERIILVGRSFGGLIAVRGAAGEHRLAALIVDPGQWDEGAAVIDRLGPIANLIDDPSADPQFTALLGNPALKALLAPRMVTNGVTTVRAYCADMRRYNNTGFAGRVTSPAFVTDNDKDEVSPGQGKILFDHLTCPKEFRLFTAAEGAQGHCEGMAPIVFWDAAYNWLDTLLAG